MSQRSVLVVDDDDTFRTRLVRAFEARGFEARGAASEKDALAIAAAESPEFAVVDLKMPGSFGLDVARALLAIDGTTRVLILTGYGSIATAVESVRLGAIDYLTKPADLDQILAALEGTSGSSTRESAEFAVPSLARVEWEHIQRVLHDCGGNISQASRLLGIHRRSLQRKLDKSVRR